MIGVVRWGRREGERVEKERERERERVIGLL